MAGPLDQFRESSMIMVQQQTPKLIERLGELFHQFAHRSHCQVLTEDSRAVRCGDFCEPSRREYFSCVKCVAQTCGDGQIARLAGTLLEVGEPARAEIDRVEYQNKRKRSLALSEKVSGGIQLGRS